MPIFQASDILRWLHLITFTLGGGGAMVCVLLLGLEESDSAYKGLSAALWKKVVAWGFRLAVLLGIGLVVLQYMRGENPFAARYFHFKMALVLLLLGVSETGARSLAKGKRGAALMAVVLFLLTTFVVQTKRSFGGRVAERAPHSDLSTPTLQAK